MEHVFQMSNIALTAWLQYLYTNDLEYLENTGFPIIRECARYYASHVVYEDSNGSMFIGKCTDLERLGPAVQNPFMTACGAIYTLESAAQAAQLLNDNGKEMKKWKIMATKLRENLPQENNMYIPFMGCREKSIATLGGLYPYPIFDKTNVTQRNAVYDFISNGKAAGNMYPMGAAVCPWYAGWIVSALALLNDTKMPLEILSDVAKSAGCFAELFEINEPGVVLHPWFSTASGNYVYAINQLLIQSKDNQIHIAPAVPESWKDYSFKLACYGNLTATVVVKGGKIENLSFTSGNPDSDSKHIAIIPSYLVDVKRLNKNETNAIEFIEGYYYMYFQIKNQTSLF
jgi:hypothetical protein